MRSAETVEGKGPTFVSPAEAIAMLENIAARSMPKSMAINWKGANN
jgi:hypothetical protein